MVIAFDPVAGSLVRGHHSLLFLAPGPSLALPNGGSQAALRHSQMLPHWIELRKGPLSWMSSKTKVNIFTSGHSLYIQAAFATF